MRCGCPECGVYMNHAEDLTMGCVCPNCGYRCAACMGTNSVIDRETLRNMKSAPPWFGERDDDDSDDEY